MFIGHEHQPFEVHENNKHIICIGSSGCVKNSKSFYTVVDIDDENIVVTKKEINFDRNGFINDMKSYQYSDRDFIAKVLLGIDNL